MNTVNRVLGSHGPIRQGINRLRCVFFQKLSPKCSHGFCSHKRATNIILMGAKVNLCIILRWDV